MLVILYKIKRHDIRFISILKKNKITNHDKSDSSGQGRWKKKGSIPTSSAIVIDVQRMRREKRRRDMRKRKVKLRLLLCIVAMPMASNSQTSYIVV